MALTAADFKIRYPEFDSVDDVTVDRFIADAEQELAEACWGDLYERGVFALAAHFLSLDQKRQAAGSGGNGEAAGSGQQAGGGTARRHGR